MKRGTKIWLIAAAVLVLAGGGLFVGAMKATNWNFSELNTVQYETNTVDVREAFRNISIDVDTADVVFVPSDDGECKAVFYEQENVRHTAAVEDGTLTVGVTDTRDWYDKFTFFTTGTPKVTLILPQTEYASLVLKTDTGDVSILQAFSFESADVTTNTGDVACSASASGRMQIESDTGDLKVEDVSAEALTLSVHTGSIDVRSAACAFDVGVNVSTGEASLADVTCRNLSSIGSTGDLRLSDVIAAGGIYVMRSTGDVQFSRCDAAELLVTTDTGDVSGTLLSEKMFIVMSDTGRVDVPKTINGGRCEIVTDTGDVRIALTDAAD